MGCAHWIQGWAWTRTVLIDHELAAANPANGKHAVAFVRAREIVGEHADLAIAVL